MAYHGGVARAPGGFLGVDLFFVLSGFLITSLLVFEHQRRGTVDLRAFWLRRARRLLPALFLVLAWVAVYAAVWADPAQLETLRSDAIATVLYVANWRFVVADESYFEQFLSPSPLRHMWSLGIEEQWYLFWPLAFVGLRRLVGSSRRLPALLVAGAVASAVLMALLEAGALDPSRAYYGTDARVQGLLLGAAAATFVQTRPDGWLARRGPVSEGLAVAGAVVLVLMVVLVDDGDRWMYRGGFALAAIASLLLVLGAWEHRPGSRVQRILSAGPLPAIGRISYGLYLWHWPTYVFLTPERTGLAGSTLLGARFAVTFAVATCSYVLVERPVRAGVLGGHRYRVVGAGVGVAGVLLAVVVATIPPSGVGADTDEGGVASRPIVPGAPKVLLVGDSIAGSLGRGMPDGTPVSLTTATFPGCGLVRGQPVAPDGTDRSSTGCASAWTSIEETVARIEPDVSVVLIGAWEAYDHRVGSELLTVGSQGYADHIVRELDALTAILGSAGGRVVVLTPPARDRRPAPRRRRPAAACSRPSAARGWPRSSAPTVPRAPAPSPSATSARWCARPASTSGSSRASRCTATASTTPPLELRWSGSGWSARWTRRSPARRDPRRRR
jgi:peptidoglycan/LPS O-acetylase OafA/YrhL